jgi:hypothetical protein
VRVEGNDWRSSTAVGVEWHFRSELTRDGSCCWVDDSGAQQTDDQIADFCLRRFLSDEEVLIPSNRDLSE